MPIGYNEDTGARDGKTLYLGCYHKIHKFRHRNTDITAMDYDVSSFIESCVRTYMELSKGVGFYEILKPSET
eukprot:8006095-Karenia_brevis.AAC.1